ncbi:MAG: dipeptidase [Candidatus Tyrphobacter sp.]
MDALREHREAGASMVTLNVADAGVTLEAALRTIASYRAQIAAHERDVLLVQVADDIERARASGRLGLCFDVEGAFSLGEQIDAVRLLYDVGVRWMSFAYNCRNAFGFGCHDERDEGLTPLGRRLVTTMDEIGMIKCCSHAGYVTARDVFERSAKPCILSHSNPLALVAHPRNVPDDVMRALAQTGGVMGITGVGLFLGARAPSADEVFAHIDYAVSLIGAEHVGIGLDSVIGRGFDIDAYVADRSYWPAGFGYEEPVTILGPSVLAGLREKMDDAGYPDAAIRGILGENFLRVARAVWRAPSFARQ